MERYSLCDFGEVQSNISVEGPTRYKKKQIPPINAFGIFLKIQKDETWIHIKISPVYIKLSESLFYQFSQSTEYFILDHCTEFHFQGILVSVITMASDLILTDQMARDTP